MPHSGKFRRTFMPDELIAVVGSKSAATGDEAIGWLEQFLIDYEGSLPTGLTVATDDPNASRSFVLDGGTQAHLLRVSLPLSSPPLFDDAAVVAAIQALNALPGDPADAIFLQAAAPNWCYAGAQSQLIGGGPGGIPVPLQNPPSIDALRASLLAVGSFSESAGDCGLPVDVVVLDTAHSEEDLAMAVRRFPEHALLQSLRHRLRVVHGPKIPTIHLPDDDVLLGYSHEPDYRMDDHGLFIAGTVHALCPDASITLVEVLNHFGAGSTLAVADALLALANGTLAHDGSLTPGGRPLVINMSFTIGAESLDDLAVTHPDWQGLRTDSQVTRTLMLPLELALNSVAQAFAAGGVHFIAAAGNDRLSGGPPVDAGFPAAYGIVTGVGALDASGSPAEYSCVPDQPQSAGTEAFGGDAAASALVSPLDHPLNLTSATSGMAGIYIGSFPDLASTAHLVDVVAWPGTPSANGWGLWSGTSFAAGVVSGVLARGLCHGQQASSVLGLGGFAAD